jgi:hypothetical protein
MNGMRYVWAALAAAIVGAGVPRLLVWRACRIRIDESCVWGRSLLPVSTTVAIIVLGIPTFLLVARLLGRREARAMPPAD